MVPSGVDLRVYQSKKYLIYPTVKLAVENYFGRPKEQRANSLLMIEGLLQVYAGSAFGKPGSFTPSHKPQSDNALIIYYAIPEELAENSEDTYYFLERLGEMPELSLFEDFTMPAAGSERAAEALIDFGEDYETGLGVLYRILEAARKIPPTAPVEIKEVKFSMADVDRLNVSLAREERAAAMVSCPFCGAQVGPPGDTCTRCFAERRPYYEIPKPVGGFLSLPVRPTSAKFVVLGQLVGAYILFSVAVTLFVILSESSAALAIAFGVPALCVAIYVGYSGLTKRIWYRRY
jgi:hypothetical protein